MIRGLIMGILCGSTLLAGGEKESISMPSLQSFATLEQLTERFKSTDGVRRFPPCSDRKAWENFAKNDLQKMYALYFINAAKADKNTPWPDCSIKHFTQFIRTGNRTNYEVPYFERRHRLITFAFAECLENKGEYIEEIAEGLWHILAEPTWVLPAHERYNPPDPVPLKCKNEPVDLFASQTGLILTAVIEMLEPQLQAYSQALIDRIKKEIIQRVIVPLEADGEEPWWLQKEIKFPSNWIPWCCSNSFAAAVYVLKDDPQRLAKLVWKMHSAVDKFIGVYKNDGACDEGPQYWTPSVGQMFQFTDYLNRRTNGLYDDFFKQPKIRSMGEFITDLNLTGNYYLNYSDAQAKMTNLSPGLIYSFGENLNSDLMKSFVLNYIRKADIESMTNAQAVRSLSIMDYLMLFRLPAENNSLKFQTRALSYFADRQIFIARQNPENPAQGVIGCIKGGHNNEGHNHNDVAQFTVYVNGKPIIVDAGAGTYTRKTFSADRYSIWWIGGMGHNAPQINGHYQMAGIEYHAKVKEFNPAPDAPSLTLDISKIYTPEAGVKEAVRKFTVDRKNGKVTVNDSLSMHNSTSNKIELKLFTPQKPVSFNDNSVKWDDAEMSLKNIKCVSVNEIDLENDAKLVSVWGKLYCINLTTEINNYQIEITSK